MTLDCYLLKLRISLLQRGYRERNMFVAQGDRDRDRDIYSKIIDEYGKQPVSTEMAVDAVSTASLSSVS
jgi:hypothetical protein